MFLEQGTFTCKQVRDVKRGEYFKLRPTDTATVWVRDEYDRTCKKYIGIDTEDINHYTFLAPNRYVYTDFTY